MFTWGKRPHVRSKESNRVAGEETGGEGGLVLLDPFGRVGYAYNTLAMSLACLEKDELVIRE